MPYQAVIRDITPMKDIVVGEWEKKKDAEEHMFFELGLHWGRYINPENVAVMLKLKEVKEVI